MKKVQMFSIAMTVVMILATVIPATPAAAREVETIMGDDGSPIQVMPSAAFYSLPEVNMYVESVEYNGYSCTLLKQSPGDWFDMKPRQSFDISWTVQNTGAVWHSGQTRFAYVGGAKMQTKGDSFIFGQDVGRGGKTKLTVDMEAPKTPGVYSTLWAIYAGNTRFCKVTVTISVTR